MNLRGPGGVIRMLLGVNLVLTAVLLGGVLVHYGLALDEAIHYRHEAEMNRAEWEACQVQHRTLLTYIQREGLWKRLGLDAQPWLTGGK